MQPENRAGSWKTDELRSHVTCTDAIRKCKKSNDDAIMTVTVLVIIIIIHIYTFVPTLVHSIRSMPTLVWLNSSPQLSGSVLPPHRMCTVNAPSLHHHCIVTAPSLHHHCTMRPRRTCDSWCGGRGTRAWWGQRCRDLSLRHLVHHINR